MAGYSEEWVDVQKNTFTRWANTYLSRKRLQIDDLYADLSDGLRLIALLQIICREKVVRKHNKKPRMRIQKMENLNFVFAFLQSKNVNVTNIGSADILDGNQKLILGLMWTLIKSFQVAEVDVEGVSGKDGLLLWVNRSLADYPTVEVKNFSSSWSNGMAFCALIHRFYPSLIDFDKLNPADAQTNVKLAFDLAREKFRIPQLLEVTDVAGRAKPDEKSIMTYVSLLFKEFASGVQKKKAVTTISKAVNIAQRHQELADEYARNASRLLEWQIQQVERFQTLSQPKRIPDIKASLANHLEYKKNEKPPREAQFVAVEGSAGLWIASCKNNNRGIPVLDPPLEKLQETKAKLDELETAFEMKLRQDLDSYQKTAIFLTRVVKELKKVESWAKEKEASDMFGDEVITTTTTDAEEKLESIAFIKEIELPRYKQLLASVVEHSESLSPEHVDTESTLERVEAMKSFVAMVENKMDSVQARLEEHLRAQQEVDAVVKDCKVLMRNLKYATEEMDEEIESATKLEDLSKDGIQAAKDHFEQVLVPKVQAAVVKDNEELLAKKHILENANRVSDVVLIERCNARVESLLESLDEKRSYFEEELSNVERRDEVSREFADLSARIKERCAQLTQSINVVEGSLTDQFASMVKLRQKLFRSNTGIAPEEEVEVQPVSPEVVATGAVSDVTDVDSVVTTEDAEKPEESVGHKPKESVSHKPEESVGHKAEETDVKKVAVAVEFAVAKKTTVADEVTVFDKVTAADETPVEKEVAVNEEPVVAKVAAATEEAAVEKEVAVAEEAAVEKEVAIVEDAAVEKEVAIVEDAAVEKEVAVVEDAAVEKEVAVVEEAVVAEAAVVEEPVVAEEVAVAEVAKEATVTKEIAVAKEFVVEKKVAAEEVKTASNELAPLTEDMEKLELIHEEMERLHVYANPYTTDTIHNLRAQFTSLENAVRDKVKSLEKEVALSKVGNLTPQQVREIKEVFDHFDYDNDGVLARDEFIMACKGLGLSLSEDDCHDYFDKIDVDNNDEMTYEQFKDFCAEQLQSGSSEDDVRAALDILSTEGLTLGKFEEQFDVAQVEFIKKNLSKVAESDGETLDNDKFAAFVFSQ